MASKVVTLPIDETEEDENKGELKKGGEAENGEAGEISRQDSIRSERFLQKRKTIEVGEYPPHPLPPLEDEETKVVD